MKIIPAPARVELSGMSFQIKYPSTVAQITPEYLNGATRAASPYRNVCIIRKCAQLINNPLKANQPQSIIGTDFHINGVVAKPARETPNEL